MAQITARTEIGESRHRTASSGRWMKGGRKKEGTDEGKNAKKKPEREKRRKKHAKYSRQQPTTKKQVMIERRKKRERQGKGEEGKWKLEGGVCGGGRRA